MMLVVEIAIIAFIAIVALPVFMLAVEIAASCLPQRNADPSADNDRKFCVAVLIPAHNESIHMLPTIRDVKLQLGEMDRVLVIADNCTDDTAAVALAEGCEVIERNEPDRRGKGFALDFGRNHLAHNPPEVVIVIDADCRISAGAISRLAAMAGSEQAAIQAMYLMRAPVPSNPVRRIAEFAWLLKNHVRPLGLAAVRAPCPLMGTGMAFPWSLLADAPLATDNQVEDLNLGLDLALDGRPPQFCRSARVLSEFPAREAAAITQHRRWAFGYLSTAWRRLPGLLGSAIAKGSWPLLALAMDLAVPPTIVLAGLAGSTALLSLIFLCAGGAVYTLAASVTVNVVFYLSIATAWLVYGRDILTAGDIVSVPAFLLHKLEIYRPSSKQSGKSWIRTERE